MWLHILAFCGFYVGGAGQKMFNNATEVVLMRHGTTTVLAMENNYQGPPENFAMVVPVPVVVKEGQVKTLDRAVFDKIDTLGAPRLVEYWEHDPCKADDYPEDMPGRMMVEEDADESAGADDSDKKDYHVKIEAKFSVAEYNILVLSAEQSTGLDSWLRDHHYTIPPGAEPLLRPYVEQGTKWFVAKVDPKKVKFVNGMATLSPLRFYYDSPDFNLPIRLGLANSAGTQDLIVNILSPDSRFEVANYPNITVPTNLEVKDEVRNRFGEFYDALFDNALAQKPGAVVTEYAWDSGSCDPCPGPTLDGNDLLTLGGDVLQSTYKGTNMYSMTLTRLHARYGKDIGNDLVFRAVEPIVGGRGIPDAQGHMDTSVKKDGANNFQGRYVILHPWTGALACANPVRGKWGGPNGQTQQIATPATNLAFQTRGTQLSTFIAGDAPTITPLASGGAQLPNPVRQPQGCGCRAEGGAQGLVGFALLGLFLRRRPRGSTGTTASR